MLYLIHGDNTEAARNKLLELKAAAKTKEIRTLNGKRMDPNATVQALESSSLFGGDVLVVVEGFISSAKKREKAFGIILAQLLAAATTIDVVLYEEKEVEKGTLTKLGSKGEIFLFKTPVVIFQFLDSIRPGNAKTSLTLFTQVLTREPAEIVFALLVRRVRQLMVLADGLVPDGLQGWQADRLTSQARHFTIDELVVMHTSLLDIDIAIKTGSSPFTLAQRIEQILITL